MLPAGYWGTLSEDFGSPLVVGARASERGPGVLLDLPRSNPSAMVRFVSSRKRHKTNYPGVYYRLHPNGDRKYVVWFSDANGKGHTETLPAGATLEDARLRQGELKRRKSQGDRLIVTKMTVAELLDAWLETRRSSLKPSTVENY